jgi:hypothetical protein
MPELRVAITDVIFEAAERYFIVLARAETKPKEGKKKDTKEASLRTETTAEASRTPKFSRNEVTLPVGDDFTSADATLKSGSFAVRLSRVGSRETTDLVGNSEVVLQAGGEHMAELKAGKPVMIRTSINTESGKEVGKMSVHVELLDAPRPEPEPEPAPAPAPELEPAPEPAPEPEPPPPPPPPPEPQPPPQPPAPAPAPQQSEPQPPPPVQRPPPPQIPEPAPGSPYRLVTLAIRHAINLPVLGHGVKRPRYVTAPVAPRCTHGQATPPPLPH